MNETLNEIDSGRLAGLITTRRWFGHKDRALEGIEVLDQGVLDEGPPALVLALVRTRFAGGESAIYNLLLLVDADGTYRDAVDDPHRAGLLGSLMAHGDAMKGSHGVFEFNGAGLDPMAPPGSESVRVMGTEQSNTSLVLDEKVVLKLFRRVEPGPNPDIELNRMLTSEGYEHTPAEVGDITYTGTLEGEDICFDLAIAQTLATDASDGWEHVLAMLTDLYAGAPTPDLSGSALLAAVQERSEPLLAALAELGEATAEMHLALSRDDVDPSFAPEPLDQADVRAVAEGARRRIDALARAGIEAFDSLVPKLRSRIDEASEVTDTGSKTRLHGDYHLGQVLWTPRGWMLLDFEGEPLRPLDERRRKQSPLKDVAGMLRSFGYAATSALFAVTEPGTEEWARGEPWANAWETLAHDAFLQAYLGRSNERHLVPQERADLSLLLELFELDKALYELDYERSHRPAWMRIPLRGLGRIAGREALL